MITFDFTAFDFAPLALMVKALAAIVGVSFVLAVAAALRTPGKGLFGTSFELKEMDGFVLDDLLPALVIFAAEGVGILTVTDWLQALAIGGSATYVAARLPGIYLNFKTLIAPRKPAA